LRLYSSKHWDILVHGMYKLVTQQQITKTLLVSHASVLIVQFQPPQP